MISIDWKTAGSLFINGDCMEYMKTMPDKCVDLALVDPPYGINAEQGTNRASRKQFACNISKWDCSAPPKEYFIELQRVSKNQIIWGANHFIENIPLANSKHWIVWDKLNPDRCFADAELAWCSNMDNVRVFNKTRVQELNKADGGKIHPTQKPVALYTWLLQNYAHRGDKILDTHVGSASSLIACHRMGFEYWGFELDADYFRAASERLEKEKAQGRLFEPDEIKPTQESLFGGIE